MKGEFRAIADMPRATRLEGSAELPDFNFGIFRRLFAYTRPYAVMRNILFGLVVLRSIQLPVLAWGIGAIIKGPMTRHDLRGTLAGAGLFFIFAFFTALSLFFRQKLGHLLGEYVIHDLRRDLFEKLMRLPLGYYTRTKLGRIISRFTSDAEAVRNGAQNVLFGGLVQAGSMVVASVMMLSCDWRLFLVMMAMAPVLWMLNRYFRERLVRAYREVQESFSRVTTAVAESVRGIRVIQGFARQEVNAGLFHELVSDHSQYNLRVTQTESVFLPLTELNSQFFLSVLVVLGGWRVLHPGGDLQIGDLLQFFFLANMFFNPITSMGSLYNQALTAVAGAERVFRMLDAAPDWEDPPDAHPAGRPSGRVVFENVQFSYLPGRPVLHDISFVAEPGQSVALVGRTGSGKTTITGLIAKFYVPDAGLILIDGKDLRQLETASYRFNLGIVQQANFLFTGTVRENILMGRRGAPPEAAAEAARQLEILDLLEQFPQGLETPVGEGGTGLSIGQRQLICFSRAMLANPRILILDEATSAVDTITELRLQTALQHLLAGRTSFIVAHRLSTIRTASLVLVLEQGRIVEHGTHRHLLKLGGVYARLYREFMVTQVTDTPKLRVG